MLYYTIFDACYCIFFLKQLNAKANDEVQLPTGFTEMSNEEKVNWLLQVCITIVDECFLKITKMHFKR